MTDLEDDAAEDDAVADGDAVEDTDPGDLVWIGRADHQGPDVDGECLLTGDDALLGVLTRGAVVRARVIGSDGVDLVVEALELLAPGPGAAAPDAAADSTPDAAVALGAGAR